jgi:hypothetical protein
MARLGAQHYYLLHYYGAPTTYYITMARLGAQPALLKLAQHRHDPLARGHTALPALAAALAALAAALAATALAAAALAALAAALVLVLAVLGHCDGRRERRIRLGAQPLDRGVACGGEGRRTYRSVLRLTHLLG